MASAAQEVACIGIGMADMDIGEDLSVAALAAVVGRKKSETRRRRGPPQARILQQRLWPGPGQEWPAAEDTREGENAQKRRRT